MEKEKYIPLEIEIIEWDDEDIIITSTRERDETELLSAHRRSEAYQIGDEEDGE